jgi:hypothetical protein
MPGKDSSKPVKKKNSLTPEQKSRRTQQILFGALAVIMIFSMVVSLIVK